MAGALDGITIIELAAIGPVPFAGMMLGDHGARVIRIERPGDQARLGDFGANDILARNREVFQLDLKSLEGVAQLRALLHDADALIEGFRPGVLERLGFATDVLLSDNPRLVIGRSTGWGQEGPKAPLAGHDINYIALAGALHTFGPKGSKPMVPTNLIGDFGGGGMMLAFGVLAGILSARSTGMGQVIDCAMVDGAATLNAMIYTMFNSGMWQDVRGVNILDGAAHYYDTYETSDGKWISIGSIEEPFYALLLETLGLSGDPDFVYKADPVLWPRLKARLEAIFLTKTRDEWCAIMEDTDICFAPVLSLAEAPMHPHNVARGAFIKVDGVVQPAPAPRFAATPSPPVRMKGR
jgi:alpha-methylacyl-CoA racemase